VSANLVISTPQEQRVIVKLLRVQRSGIVLDKTNGGGKFTGSGLKGRGEQTIYHLLQIFYGNFLDSEQLL